MIINILIAMIAIESFGIYVKCGPVESTPQIKNIVEDSGYSFEEHYVATDDGYIITLHRVFNSSSESQEQKPVALCVHGLVGSSADWLITGQNVSMGFLLADSGYDVWLFNSRGVKNSKKHIVYLSTSYQFWNFSVHEIGFYDLPATIDYVLNATRQEDLFYVGFSQGGTILFIMGSLKPEYNKKIRMAGLLAPAVYLDSFNGCLRDIFEHSYSLSAILDESGHFELFPEDAFWRVLTNFLCREGAPTQIHCYMAYFSLVGDGTDEKDPASFTKYLTHFPTGVSTKQLFYFVFAKLNFGRFRQYDYGSVKNEKVYNSSQPPEYPIHKVDIPVAIFQGLNDILVTNQGIDLLVKNIPKVIYREMITKKKLNHLDLIYGADMRELAYLKILKLFEVFRKNKD